MRFHFTVFIFLATTFFGYSQNYIPYHNLANEAEVHLYHRNFDQAAEKYYAAFDLEEPLPWDSYHLVYCLDQLDPIANNLEMKRWLLHASTRSWKTMRWLNEMPLSTTFSELFYYDIRLNGEAFTAQSKPLRDKLMHLAERGEIRNLFMDSIRVYYANNDERYIRYKKLMLQEDSTKQAEYLKLIQEEGYPGMKLCGVDYSLSRLNNAPEYLFDTFRILLMQELKKGNIGPFQYGAIIDRLSWKYNDEISYAASRQKDLPIPLKAELLENRRKIGMSLFFKLPSYGINILEGEMILLE